jgi:hypothetical protein
LYLRGALIEETETWSEPAPGAFHILIDGVDIFSDDRQHLEMIAFAHLIAHETED